jgi:predicted nucleic acid-binding protein
VPELLALGEITLIAPDLLLTELASLIMRRKRRKQMPAAAGQEAFWLMAESELRLFETRPLLARALDLAIKSQSLWDCVYLALAIEHDCQLITVDFGLFRAANGWHPAIRLLG